MRFLPFYLLMALLSLSACKKDPCENLICLNGGICDDGDCQCPENYTGANCGDQVTPDRIHISEVRILSWPAMRDTLPWDSDSEPDLSFVITDKQNNELLRSDSTYHDVTAGTVLMKTFITPLMVNEVSVRYQLKLYDEDPGGFREFMEGIEFSLYSSFNGFPSTLILDGGGDLRAEIDLSYEYAN